MAVEGGEVTTILRDLESLKSSKSEIELRISALEARLEEINFKQPNGAVLNGSCAPVSSSVDSGYGQDLSSQMIYRYSRQLLLTSFGVQGINEIGSVQSKLLKSSVLVVGAGGLGSPALLYLAACGVGRLGVVDHDVVELNNMHRQIIHAEKFIGQPKVKSATATCRSESVLRYSTIEAVEGPEVLLLNNLSFPFYFCDVVLVLSRSTEIKNRLFGECIQS